MQFAPAQTGVGLVATARAGDAATVMLYKTDAIKIKEVRIEIDLDVFRTGSPKARVTPNGVKPNAAIFAPQLLGLRQN